MSTPESPEPAITPVILHTLLGRLALLFLSGADNDPTAARHAASHMLAAYNAETDNELRLAANVISFSFHALEALSQAATPDMPLNKILRLRGSAVSLSREANKAERRLDQLQAARRTGAPVDAPAEIAPPRPQIAKAIALVETTREMIAAAGQIGAMPQIGGKPQTGAMPWTAASQKREAARRITENLRRNQAATHQGTAV
jgi:hypothetical protein